MNPDQIFSSFVPTNRWNGNASVSGTGSDPKQTEVVARQLPHLLRDLNVKVLLDVPCGDFEWMKEIDLGGVEYIGADIVEDLSNRNNVLYARPDREFIRRNLLTDKLPEADLVICRDCLVHFSYRDIRIALENLRASGAEYLLTTSFINRRKNKDIVTGLWRPLNLEAAPFFFPAPEQVIDEECTEEGGAYNDKSLCLWKVKDLPVMAAEN